MIRTALALVCSSSIAVAGCLPEEHGAEAAAQPVALVRSDGGPSAEAEPPRVAASDLAQASVRRRPSASSGTALPAPSIARDLRSTAPSSTMLHACRRDVPPGPCDRCPTRACRQVRLELTLPPGEAPWAMVCDEGDLIEESEIACLCAGGLPAVCARSAVDTAVAVRMVDSLFGGVVPPVGTRYRDSAGLRAVIDQTAHDWLAASHGPPPVLRCDVPDREAAARTYLEHAQQVRRTGTCE